LVKGYRGLFSFFGSKLFEEKNVYLAARIAGVLDLFYPINSMPGAFKNPVLSNFANAVWHCSTAAEVAVTLGKAADSDLAFRVADATAAPS
jgi:hypothetical protein